MARVVVDLIGLHRANDADVVGDLADMGKECANLLAGLAVPVEGELGRHAHQLLEALQLGERTRHRLTYRPQHVQSCVDLLYACNHCTTERPRPSEKASRAYDSFLAPYANAAASMKWPRISVAQNARSIVPKLSVANKAHHRARRWHMYHSSLLIAGLSRGMRDKTVE